MLDGTYFFECECGGDEHTLKFILDKKDNTLYTSVYLNQYRSFFKRVWTAIKYIFGYRSTYGHWDCWTLRKEDMDKLRIMLAIMREGEQR